MKFRKDINALRAIGVIAVVIFHFNPKWLPGGFSGVDVFFVISGFLMTKIIFTKIEEGRFSFVDFYFSRANRIIPPLALLSLSLMAAGFLFVIPKDFETIAKHALSSLLFFSNFIYLGEINYFDQSANEKWLLHTWSLSVEWQFYIIYPIILLGIAKTFVLDTAKKAVLAFAIISFGYGVFLSKTSPNEAFYLLAPRAWEMFFGGIAYLYPFRMNGLLRMITAYLGWITIIAACFVLSETNMWPGYLAAIPVLGTFMVIQANYKESYLARNRVLQSVGLHSYSLYLWHWPILVAAGYFYWGNRLFIATLTIAALSIASYRFAEKNRIKRTQTVLLLTVGVSTTSFVFLNSGLQGRIAEEFRLNAEEYHNRFYGGSNYPANRVLQFGEDGMEVNVIIAGDSYALQYAGEIDKITQDKRLKITGLFDHGCLIFPRLTRYLKEKEDISCSREYNLLRNELEKNPSTPLILAYSWNGYYDRLGEKGGSAPLSFNDMNQYHSVIFDELSLLMEENGVDRHYYLVGSPPQTSRSAFQCLAQTELIGARFLNPCKESDEEAQNVTNDALKKFAQSRPNVIFIDPAKALCKEKKCLVIKNRQPLYSDRTHLSVYGAEMVAPFIFSSAGLYTMPSKNTKPQGDAAYLHGSKE